MMKMFSGINPGTILLFIVLISFIAVFTACVVLLIKRAFAHNLSPSFHYYVWLIFVLRLLFPLTPASDISVYNLAVGIYNAAANFEVGSQGADSIEENITAPAASSNTEKSQNVPNATDYEPTEYILPESDSLYVTNAEKISEANENKISPIQVIFAAYIIIALSSIVSYAVKHRSYRRKILRSFSEADRGEQEILSQIMQNLGIRRKISLYKGEESMLIGVFSPLMVISHECAESDKRAVITHELLHYKNKDNLVNCLLILIKCVYWFNPFIHYFVHRIKNDMELLCDVKSIRILNYRKDEYAMMLFNASNKNNKDKGKNKMREDVPSQATCMSASGKQLIYRLKFISQFKKSNKIISAIAFVLVVALIATTLTNPIFAANEEWAQPYAEFLSAQGIGEYKDTKLGDEMTASEYATALLNGLKSLSLPYELKSKITAIKNGGALIDIANAALDESDKISPSKAITREQAAYITDTAINYLDLYFNDGDSYETPIDFTTLTFVPDVLTEDMFENEVLAKIDDQGRIYAKLNAYFSKRDINDPEMTERAVEELKVVYPALIPLLEKTAVYIFDPNASERERLEILGYLNQYTTLSDGDIVKMFMENSIPYINFAPSINEVEIIRPIRISPLDVLNRSNDEESQAKFDKIIEIMKNAYIETTLADKILTQDEYDDAVKQYVLTNVTSVYIYYKLKDNVTDMQKKEIAEILSGYDNIYRQNTEDKPREYWDKYEQFDDKYNIPILVYKYAFDYIFEDIYKQPKDTAKALKAENDKNKLFSEYYEVVDYASENMVDIVPEEITIYKLRNDIPEDDMARMESYLLFDQYGKTRFAVFEINEASAYKDTDKISAYALNSVDKMHKVGFMTGEDNGSFKPNAKLTWGQSAKILNNILCGICVY